MRAALALALVGCGSSSPAAPDITGTLVIRGTDVSAKMRCKPGAAVHIFVDIETPEGTLRFEDQKLRLGGEELACSRLDRRWNGARRPNGTAYWRGTLAFDCASDAGPIRGDLDLACGNITLEEKAQLDKAARELEEQKRRNATEGSAASGSAAEGSAAGSAGGAN